MSFVFVATQFIRLVYLILVTIWNRLSAQESGDDVMPDDELIKRKNQIAKEYNGIWTLSENDVTLIQKQFDCTKEIEDEYNQLILEAK